MRHKKNFNHLGRKRGHRRALLSNMASSLLIHKRIKTTTAKAKALKAYVEPLITKAKNDTTHSRRTVFSYLQDKEATSELFRDVVVKVGDRPGGYTRIIKLGNRLGDNADMCIIELVDYNDAMLSDKAAASKTASRRRRGGKKKTDVDAGAAVEEAVIAEKAVEAAAEVNVEAPVKEAAPEAPVEEAPKAEAEETKEEKKEE